MTGLILFAHGSSVESANAAVRAVTASLDVGGYDLIETAFLELGAPDLPHAVDSLAERGATRIVVVPYFLTLGIHLQRDLPRIVDEIRQAHPRIHIEVTEPLDGHPALLQVVLDRARTALARQR